MSLLKVNTVQTDTLKSIAGVNRNIVLQVVSGVFDTEFSTTSTSFVDTPVTLSITPTSATSKIYVMTSVHTTSTRSSSVLYYALRLMRGETEIYAPYGNNGTGNLLTGGIGVSNATSLTLHALQPLIYLDSPGTTAEITYTVQGCVYVNTSSGTLIVNNDTTTGGQTSTMTLMEIAQ